MSAEVEAKASMAALADNILKAMELAKEFRRLAADIRRSIHEGRAGFSATKAATAWEQAAQMLEERLNG